MLFALLAFSMFTKSLSGRHRTAAVNPAPYSPARTSLTRSSSGAYGASLKTGSSQHSDGLSAVLSNGQPSSSMSSTASLPELVHASPPAGVSRVRSSLSGDLRDANPADFFLNPQGQLQLRGATRGAGSTGSPFIDDALPPGHHQQGTPEIQSAQGAGNGRAPSTGHQQDSIPPNTRQSQQLESTSSSPPLGRKRFLQLRGQEKALNKLGLRPSRNEDGKLTLEGLSENQKTTLKNNGFDLDGNVVTRRWSGEQVAGVAIGSAAVTAGGMEVADTLNENDLEVSI